MTKNKLLFCFLFLLTIAIILNQLEIKQRSKSFDKKVTDLYRQVEKSNKQTYRESDKNLEKIEELKSIIEKSTSLSQKGLYLEYPFNNIVYQRNKENTAEIKFSILLNEEKILPNTINVILLSLGNNRQIANKSFKAKEKTDGSFKNIEVGLYKLCVSVTSKIKECKSVAVGDAFLILGQSNAVSPAQNHPKMISKFEKIFVNNTYQNGSFAFFDLDSPSEKIPFSMGITWIYLGDMIYERFKVPTAFYILARGGTSTEDWAPSTDWLFRRVEKFFSSYNSGLTAILWHQGEANVGEKISFENGLNHMKSLIGKTNKLSGDVPWIIALNSHKFGERSDILKVQKKIIEEGIAKKGPNTDVLRETPSFLEATGGEFIGNGLKKHAELWFSSLKNNVSAYSSEPK